MSMVRTLTFLVMAALAGLPGRAQTPSKPQPFRTAATHALLIDRATGATLFAKNADEPIGLAATAKIMVALVIIEALRNGEISLSTEYTVSEDAWRRGGGPSGGPSMFAGLETRIAVADLLRGLMIQGGNDACLILAEGLSGSEPAFVQRMNLLAGKLGLTKTTFTNVTGKADPGQMTTLGEAARLAAHIQQTHPQWYAIYSEREFTWNGVRQFNRNPLIAGVKGSDGLAVGSADQTSADLVGSAQRDGKHFILVLEAKSAKERNEEAGRILEWGFKSFVSVAVFKAGEIIGHARVFGGGKTEVPVAAADSIRALLPRENLARLEGQIVYQGPIPAPVKTGDPIGILRLKNQGKIVSEVPVRAAADVPRGGFFRRATDAVIELGISLVRGGTGGS